MMRAYFSFYALRRDGNICFTDSSVIHLRLYSNEFLEFLLGKSILINSLGAVGILEIDFLALGF